MKSLGAVLLATILYFAWGAISHMLLPWHESSMRGFADEADVVAQIQEGAPESGLYIFPYLDPKNEDESVKKEAMEKWEKGPVVFASVSHEGGRSMAEAMGIQAVSCLVAALMLAFILKLGGARSFLARYGIVLASAVLLAVLGPIAQWNWWRFSDATTVAYLIDIIVGWAIAGLPLAAIGRGGKGGK